ncbi:aldo/keto reductase [Metabacillus arenae]|uniref:Aldo/keto reductase n=1 Tax=Metabacillus arenae TaxID=2771434 RepID=A0A926NCV6_9BACI|nr:aldo/keto reductase [Metabacillus arenae]MBD1381922.1 aldo/keto reductase [Metabacillus arenae]
MKNNISKLIMGTAQLGQKYGIANKTGKPNKKDALDMIHYAVSKGIASFDTAPEYGESESLLGEFISSQEALKRKIPRIITKIPSVHFNNNPAPNDILTYVKHMVTTSLNKLNIHAIDVCLLHNPGDMTSYNGKAVESLVNLKNEGLIKKIGVSIYHPDEVKQVISLDSFDVVQIPMNILDHRLINSGLLMELANHEMDIYARSVYLQGLLFLDPEDVPQNLIKTAKEPLEKLKKLSVETRLSPSELSMLFVRDMPEVNNILIGCETKKQVESNLKLMAIPKLSDDIVKQIRFLFKDVSEELVNPKMWI